MYIRAFHLVNDFPPIQDLKDEAEFSLMINNLLEDFKYVVTQLADGFKACRKHMKVYVYRKHLKYELNYTIED